jgi:hypothetical protein
MPRPKGSKDRNPGARKRRDNLTNPNIAANVFQPGESGGRTELVSGRVTPDVYEYLSGIKPSSLNMGERIEKAVRKLMAQEASNQGEIE